MLRQQARGRRLPEQQGAQPYADGLMSPPSLSARAPQGGGQSRTGGKATRDVGDPSVLQRSIRLLPLVAQAAVPLVVTSAALAVDDKATCVAARQLALAAEKDVGLWVDKVTRNAGMSVSCERKRIEFTRFTYMRSSSMDDAWTQRKAADWSATYCANPVWSEALQSGWRIVLSVTAADGGRVAVDAKCR